MADREKIPCKSCGAPIFFAQTVSGSTMPIDYEPHPEGNVVLVDGVAHTLRGDLWEGMHDGPKYRSHFVTCPQARSHRKKK